jgi:acyl-phosphate glycerol 3-phosphate acyltransferase
MDALRYAAVAFFAYLLGSIPSGVIAARAFARVDVRATGSGHTGAINTFRSAGFAAAALTLLADGAKGVLAISAERQWAGNGWGIPIAATLVVIGHCYPLYTRFRGGMGLTTAGGVFLVLQPLLLAALIAIWFPVKWLWGLSVRPQSRPPTRIAISALAPQGKRDESPYASLVVALLLPVLLFFARAEPSLQAAGVGVAAVLLWRHLQVLVWRRHIVRLPW